MAAEIDGSWLKTGELGSDSEQAAPQSPQAGHQEACGFGLLLLWMRTDPSHGGTPPSASEPTDVLVCHLHGDFHDQRRGEMYQWFLIQGEMIEVQACFCQLFPSLLCRSPVYSRDDGGCMSSPFGKQRCPRQLTQKGVVQEMQNVAGQQQA
eukprot:CAMPEP_0117694284 /NCGR_PEP_ID=MMETSP0804-20121206/27365_1 /TAXON_ID=1074897 /ORGANISM="Tetraselmis astigmatica, Strain CCMP880" /LENGTH=150 /DNA_ID=CAMNT_0005507961 /DNA_START=1342 /DNA_END=1794 /DNA_ORIENTATION=+